MYAFAPFVLVAPALAQDPDADALDGFASEVLAVADHPARAALITERLATLEDANDIARASTALAVVRQLDAQGRTDKTITRWFVEAALSLDPATRQAALEAAKAGGDPPTAPEPASSTVMVIREPEPAAESDDDEALAAYRLRSLHRDSLTTFYMGGNAATGGVYGGSVHTWGVYDGGGAPLTARTFAEVVGDDATLTRIETGKGRTMRAAIGVGVASVALIGLGFYAVGESTRAYAEGRPNGGLQTAGILGLTAGSVGLGVAIALPLFRAQRLNYVSRYYAIPDADRWIDEHNDALREELGLPDGVE